jgi:hypothetical protein
MKSFLSLHLSICSRFYLSGDAKEISNLAIEHQGEDLKVEDSPHGSFAMILVHRLEHVTNH